MIRTHYRIVSTLAAVAIVAAVVAYVQTTVTAEKLATSQSKGKNAGRSVATNANVCAQTERTEQVHFVGCGGFF